MLRKTGRRACQGKGDGEGTEMKGKFLFISATSERRVERLFFFVSRTSRIAGHVPADLSFCKLLFKLKSPVICVYQNRGSPVRTSVLERKKEAADVALSRQALVVTLYSRVVILLRKPGKRNGADFF